MLDVLDAVLELMEPGGAIDADTGVRNATSGTTVDHNAASAFDLEFAPDRLYGWPVNDLHQVFEAGDPPSQRERFTLTLLYVAGNEGEESARRRIRSVSEALDTKAHTYLSRLAASRVPPDGSPLPWGELGGEVNPDTIRGFNVRGVGLRLTGWRYLQGA